MFYCMMILLPLWKDFSEAISAVTANAYRCFLVIIQDVQLSRHVLDLLAPALNQAPIGGLLMRNNRLPRDGIRFVSKFVELNSSLKCLAARNKIESELDAISLLSRPSGETSSKYRKPHSTSSWLGPKTKLDGSHHSCSSQ